MSATDLAQAVGEQLRLARAGSAWSVQQVAEAAGVQVDSVKALEHGLGSLRDFLALASAFGFGHELWNATRPRAENLDELERIEHAIADRAAGGSAA